MNIFIVMSLALSTIAAENSKVVLTSLGLVNPSLLKIAILPIRSPENALCGGGLQLKATPIKTIVRGTGLNDR